MEELKIVMMNGGLGNQLYQYAFLRFLEVNTGQKCWVDDSAFWGDRIEHNGYELERVFNIKLNKLSDFFTRDVWKEMILLKKQGVSIPQQLLDNGLNLMLVAESRDFKFDGNMVFINPKQINEAILNVFVNTQGLVYYHGYFCNSIYINIMKDLLRKELVFSPLKDSMEADTINKRYQELIQLTDSVAVHIRRGDFIKCGRAISSDKYAKAIRQFEEREKIYTYFIFSDDIGWCKEHIEELGLDEIKDEHYFVEENIGNHNNYIDMQLMSTCKNMIISNSSFGIWSYYLNTTPNLEMVFVDSL